MVRERREQIKLDRSHQAQLRRQGKGKGKGRASKSSHRSYEMSHDCCLAGGVGARSCSRLQE